MNISVMPEVDVSFFNRVNDVYDLKGRMGRTDYIDFLTQNEVPKNIMKGIDCYGRRFLMLKVGGIDLNTGRFFKSGQVFFERYSNEPYLASADFEGMFIWTTGGTTPIQYKLINDLVDGKLVKLEEEHRFNSSDCNVIIATMDYWEKKFAQIIQRNWKMCRYNPKYSICKKFLNEQYDEYINSINK